MASQYISQVGALVDEVESLQGSEELLFRGQTQNLPLIPKIARLDPTVDTTRLEREMLQELKRRTAREAHRLGSDAWDALVVAQHYGMATRLLDWTTNPLIALWFAICDMNAKTSGYLFMLPVTADMILNRAESPDPFSTGKTLVFKPSVNNERLSAQSGWFTAHKYSRKARRFVDLHKNRELKRRVLMKGIRGRDKVPLLRALDRLGINQETIFPGLEGTCRYLDWRFQMRDA